MLYLVTFRFHTVELLLFSIDFIRDIVLHVFAHLDTHIHSPDKFILFINPFVSIFCSAIELLAICFTSLRC